MLSFSSVLGAFLLSAAAVILLKSFGFRGAPIISVLALLIFMNESSEVFSQMASFYSELSDYANIEGFAQSCIKIIGISYLGGISSDVCREIGEGGIAGFITYVERVEMVGLATPYIKEAVALALGVLGG